MKTNNYVLTLEEAITLNERGFELPVNDGRVSAIRREKYEIYGDNNITSVSSNEGTVSSHIGDKNVLGSICEYYSGLEEYEGGWELFIS